MKKIISRKFSMQGFTAGFAQASATGGAAHTTSLAGHDHNHASNHEGRLLSGHLDREEIYDFTLTTP